MSETLTASTPVWRWSAAGGSGAWFFVRFGGEDADVLSATALMRKLEGAGRGFGSLRVTATIGETSWQTSVFPDKSGEWWLPLKASVRKAEMIVEGDTVQVKIAF